MNQLLSSELFKWATFCHNLHNVTIFFLFSFDPTWLFLVQCRMKIRTPYDTNVIMGNKSFFFFALNIISWLVKRSLRKRAGINSAELNFVSLWREKNRRLRDWLTNEIIHWLNGYQNDQNTEGMTDRWIGGRTD